MKTSETPIDGRAMSSRTSWSILLPTLAVSSLLLLGGLAGAWYVHRANRHVSHLLGERLASSQAAERLVFEIRELRLALANFADTGESSQLDAAGAMLDEIDRSAHEVDGYDDEALPGALAAFAGKVNQLSGVPQETREATVRQLVSELKHDLLDPAEQILKRRQAETEATSLRNQEIAQRIGLGLLLLGICGSGAGLLTGFAMARSVHRSMLQISLPVHDMAGRLNEVVGPINVTVNTKLSGLDEVLRTLADKTADVVQHLQESQQQAMRNEQLAAIGRLGAGLAHELRNPLMSMKLIVQTATERYGHAAGSPTDATHPRRDQGVSPSTDQAHDRLLPRDLAILQEEIARLEKMLQTFLDFARPPRPEKQPVDIRLLVVRTLAFVRPRAYSQDVVLHGPEVEDPLWIEGDESQLRQVLLNLLLNALDAMPEGGNVWVDVDAASPPPTLAGDERRQAEGKYVSIGVRDDGPGMPAEVSERIFEPFVSTKPNGIGLGLSICRRIVESHDGQIAARNRQPGGAEFMIYLPLRSPSLPRASGKTEAAMAGNRRDDSEWI
jgi:signal transduction histidine kinase